VDGRLFVAWRAGCGPFLELLTPADCSLDDGGIFLGGAAPPTLMLA
jgi:hypothetical protein